MEYVKLVAEIIARWIAMGTIVIYICCSLSYISGLIESGCNLRHGILTYLIKAPGHIFKVWMNGPKYTVKGILLWPFTLIDYGGILYDQYSQLNKKS